MALTIETEEELRTLAELTYLGDYVVNACRLVDERVQKYHDMMDRVTEAHYEVCEDKEDTIGDMGNPVLRAFLDYFSEHQCIEKFVHKYVDAKHPRNEKGGIEGYFSRVSLWELYENELHKHGFGIVDIKVEDLDKKIQNAETSTDLLTTATEFLELGRELSQREGLEEIGEKVKNIADKIAACAIERFKITAKLTIPKELTNKEIPVDAIEELKLFFENIIEKYNLVDTIIEETNA